MGEMERRETVRVEGKGVGEEKRGRHRVRVGERQSEKKGRDSEERRRGGR